MNDIGHDSWVYQSLFLRAVSKRIQPEWMSTIARTAWYVMRAGFHRIVAVPIESQWDNCQPFRPVGGRFGQIPDKSGTFRSPGSQHRDVCDPLL